MPLVEIGSVVRWRETSSQTVAATHTRRIIDAQEFVERMDRIMDGLGSNPRSAFEAKARIYGEFMEHTALVSQALLGQAIGDTVEVATPAGLKQIRILSIE